MNALRLAAVRRYRPLVDFLTPATFAGAPRMIVGLAGAGALFGSGATVALASPALEVGTAASLLIAGAVLFRLVLQASRHSVDVSAELEGRLVARVEALEQDLRDERARAVRLLLAWEVERAARVALSNADGLTVAAELEHVLQLADRLGVQLETHRGDLP